MIGKIVYVETQYNIYTHFDFLNIIMSCVFLWQYLNIKQNSITKSIFNVWTYTDSLQVILSWKGIWIKKWHSSINELYRTEFDLKHSRKSTSLQETFANPHQCINTVTVIHTWTQTKQSETEASIMWMCYYTHTGCTYLHASQIPTHSSWQKFYRIIKLLFFLNKIHEAPLTIR